MDVENERLIKEAIYRRFVKEATCGRLVKEAIYRSRKWKIYKGGYI